MSKNIIAILNNLRSIHNVASCFRTADGAGLNKIYLVGTTPTPLDRFGRPRPAFTKVSLGAENSVPYESFSNLASLITKLKTDNFLITAVEQNPKSVNLLAFARHAKQTNLALIFGNEPAGLSSADLSLCDKILEIPMYGQKESLNVSVAFGLATYAFINK